MTSRTRRTATAALAAATVGLVAACGGGSFQEPGGGGAGSEAPSGPITLDVLIASSGDAETNTVKTAAAAWAKETGNTANVQVAQNITQQLAQGFAGGNPPDVFYVDAAAFGNLAQAGNLEPYASQIPDNDDFYESLRQTFTYEDQQYCVPKDFSTLALQIREDAWTKAGLTEADVPKDWASLKAVAQKLTSGKQVGIAIGDNRDRIGAFMVQAGGWIVDEAGTAATADTPENVEALTYVKDLYDSGVASPPSKLDAGWSGEAFGTGRAAMTIEGNWIRGAMKNDYPDVEYTVAPLPDGPAGKGTLLFTQCWGIAADSEAKAAAVGLVQALTTPEAQLAAATAFGVMPSRQSVQEAYVKEFPDDAPFIAGGEYGQGPVNAPGMDAVLADFDASLQQLASQQPAQILKQLQTNAQAALGG